jgi:uncharacterized membrane protein
MRAWAYMLGGLIIWAIHFFAVYIAASIFLTSTTSRIITLLVTLACLASAAVLAVLGWAGRSRTEEPFGRWSHDIAALSGAAAFIAVAWQGLPALLI